MWGLVGNSWCHESICYSLASTYHGLEPLKLGDKDAGRRTIAGSCVCIGQKLFGNRQEDKFVGNCKKYGTRGTEMM